MLDDVDVLVPSGTFNLIVGPNGSGKTTLLRMLATLTPPSSGRIHWSRSDGTTLAEPAEIRTNLGYAGHTPLVYDELTVRENIETSLLVRGMSTTHAHETTREWLGRFGLATRARERADTLSRGLRQRVALVQALAPQPDILLLDEPASNLDEAGLETLLKVLREARGKSTVLLATHEPDPFRPFAERVLEIRDGKIRDWGAAA